MKNILKILFLLCCLLTVKQIIFAQDPAQLNCLEVNPNGDVEIYWQQPANASGFEKYVIYYSQNGSSFNAITSINDVSNETYLHSSADAGTASRYYYIETYYSGIPVLSDTMRTIFLQLNNLNFNEAKLYWNGLYLTPAENISIEYNIYKEYPLGNWNILTTLTGQTEYSEMVIVCQDSINYRIEVENNAGCNSVSNIKGEWFKNIEEPAKPIIDSISVNNNENIVLGWGAVPEAAAYIVYRFETGIWKSIDTVFGVNNTFYEDIYSDPCSESLTYSVATIDTCGSSGPKDENEERKSLRVGTLEYDACAESVHLKWNNYFGPSAETYEIWMAENDADFNLVGKTATGITDFSYPINTVGAQYNFFVRAKFPGGTSTTCKRSIKTYSYQKPQTVYFANADVLPTDKIELTIQVDTLVNSCTWEIYRDDIQAVVTEKIATITKDETNSFPLTYIDETAFPYKGYYYSALVLDSCGNQVLESNFIKTIVLSGNSMGILRNKLEWNAQEGWNNEVEKYYIFRMINDIEPSGPIDSVGGNTLEYVDDLSLFSNSTILPVYWVQAIEKSGPDQTGEKARSNRISITKETEMYMANAFRPGGYTPVFKPVFRFYNGQNYLFQVFNRWGKLLFDTNNPDVGWDGNYEGKLVQTGTYIYRLVYHNPDNSSTEKKGTFTLIY